MKNYYEIWEVNKKASREIIDKAYKVLVKKYHPDLYESQKKQYATKKIKEINEAYHILSDDFLREQYDIELEKQEIEQLNKKYQIKQNNINNSNQEKQTNKLKEPNKRSNTKNKREIENKNKNNVGTLAGLIELCKEIYKSKPKREEFKRNTKKDILALILAIIGVIIIGIILWFIPFTNSWMRELLFENVLFNSIGSLFTK